MIKVKNLIFILFILLSFILFTKDNGMSHSLSLLNKNEYILEDMNIISMVKEDDIYKGAVHIKDGKIYKIYKDQDPILGDILSLDMKGKYMLPGLSDMHVHGNSASTNSEFLAYGVTLVRVMAGSETHLIRRDSINNKDILGPEMFVGSMLIDGPDPYWPNLSIVLKEVQEVRPILTDIYEKKYDFIKIYNNLSQEVFNEIMSVSSDLGLDVSGHIPVAVDAIYASNKGLLSSEHLYGHLVGERNPRKVDTEIEAIIQAGMWICPTPYIYNLNYSDPSYLNGVDYWEVLNYIKKFHDKGGGVVSGTDESNAFAPAGLSLHQTLEMMIEAGLTPYEVLETATINPAIMLKLDHRLGTIESGKDADCIILNENPLENIENTLKIYGVITKGRYLDSKWIQKNQGKK